MVLKDQQKIRLTPSQAIDAAFHHYSNGRLQAAKRIIEAILHVRPNDTNALNLGAANELASGCAHGALKLMEKAVKLEPHNPVFLANLAEMRRRAGDVNGGLEAARLGVSANPSLALTQSNLGILLYQSGDLKGAEAAQKAALKIDSKHVRAINNLGSIARDKGDLGEAAKYYRKALLLVSSDDDILANLCTVLLEDDREHEVLRLLLPYIRMRQKVSAEIYVLVGKAYLACGALDDAEKFFNTAISIDPQHVIAHVCLSQALQERRDIGRALQEAEKAVNIDPASAHAYQQVGLCLADLRHPERSWEAHKRALELKPDFYEAIVSLGYYSMQVGDVSEARTFFERAIAIKANDFSGYLGLVRLGGVTEGDASMITLEKAVSELDTMNPKRAVSLHYALGKSYEDQKLFSKAWPHFAAGAALKRKEISYNIEAFEKLINNIIEVMDADTISGLRDFSIPSAQPIFILGMPRSGSTLIESILASHPQVHGAGELVDLQRLLPIDVGDLSNRYPNIIRNKNGLGLARIAENYLEEIIKHSPNSTYIIDKMPSNFLYLGLIHALIPNAQILHTVRDPIDTCVSCFTNFFDRSQLHSYDQVEMARYFNGYQKIMEHWRKVLPKDAFYDVKYENVIENFETQARHLIEKCNLPWDASCLNFYTTKRSINTASLMQVRQPIYTSSVRKWKAYEENLKPMLAALEPSVWKWSENLA
jgi:tetratricopeptide (TPR) repeat protein